MEQIDLSLVIACYNEEKILTESIAQICNVLNLTKLKYEIIFVDDGSEDRTLKIIKELIAQNPNMRLLAHERNMGRGKAVSDGINIAKGRIVGFIDIDLEAHARYIPSMILEINKGTDVAIGWRIYKIEINSLHRWLASRIYHWLVRKILKVPLKDTESGYKFFRREKILPIIKMVEDTQWFWDTEIMAHCYYQKLKIVEVPVLFMKRTDKKSKVNFSKDSIIYFYKLLKFRKRLKTISPE